MFVWIRACSYLSRAETSIYLPKLNDFPYSNNAFSSYFTKFVFSAPWAHLTIKQIYLRRQRLLRLPWHQLYPPTHISPSKLHYPKLLGFQPVYTHFSSMLTTNSIYEWPQAPSHELSSLTYPSSADIHSINLLMIYRGLFYHTQFSG